MNARSRTVRAHHDPTRVLLGAHASRTRLITPNLPTIVLMAISKFPRGLFALPVLYYSYTFVPGRLDAMRSAPLASRFTVDGSARFVPVSIAENDMHSHNLSLDDYRETPSPAKVPQGMAPFVDMAGRIRGPAAPPPGESWPDDSANSISHAVNRRGPLPSRVAPGLPTSGKANAKRAGGKLGPVTITSTPSVKRRPVRRCEFALVATYTNDSHSLVD